jgi:hypothetical protein
MILFILCLFDLCKMTSKFFSYLFSIRKVDKKIILNQKKLFSRSIFIFIFGEIHFLKVIKIICYLFIILDLVFNILYIFYFLFFIFYFLFHPFKFNLI